MIHRLAFTRNNVRTVIGVEAETQAQAVDLLGIYLHEDTFLSGADTTEDAVFLAILRDKVLHSRIEFDLAISLLQAEETRQSTPQEVPDAYPEEGV